MVEVNNLVKSFRSKARRRGPVSEVVAVDGVSLSVRPAEFLVLLGPSGCGKTTLLRSIAGLDKPNRGTIRIGGRTVCSSEPPTFVPPDRRGVGMMFQSYALWPHMPVFKQVAFPLVAQSNFSRDEVHDRVLTALDHVGVSGLERRYPSELSGGQQQRVALARALVAKPPLVLFDEPLSNVDAKVRRELRAQFRELKAVDGFAAIYVTHDQDEALELADNLVVMSQGKIIQSGDPRSVYEEPNSVEVASFVGELVLLTASVTTADSSVVEVDTCIGSLRLGAAALPGRYVGERGHVAFRPESTRVVAPTSEAPHGCVHVPCTVVDVLYHGADTEVLLDAEGKRLTSTGGVGRMPVARGDRAILEISEGSVQWLTR